jgi:uncharacterized protein (DUF362 family)
MSGHFDNARTHILDPSMTDSDKTRKFNRRKFIKYGICGAGAAALGGVYFGGVRRLTSIWSPGGFICFKGPEPLPPTRVYPDMPPAVVSVAGVEDSIEKTVREAVAAAGGLDEIQPGQRVLIKPNICGPSNGKIDIGRITTKPEVVRAVIRMVKERGAHAIIGDRSFSDTEKAFLWCGFARVCEEEGAEPYPWTRAEYVRFYPGKRYWSRGFRMPKILQEVDHFINVPILKNHDQTAAEFTCCLKAFVGVAHNLDRFQPGSNALHQYNISEKIAELNLCAKPLINIVDATTILVKGGPDAGYGAGGLSDPARAENVTWAQPNLILASKDRVACDSVALAALKLYGAENKIELPYVTRSVWDQPQIYYAAELGIGQADPSMIKIEDLNVPRIDEIKANWA